MCSAAGVDYQYIASVDTTTQINRYSIVLSRAIFVVFTSRLVWQIFARRLQEYKYGSAGCFRMTAKKFELITQARNQPIS